MANLLLIKDLASKKNLSIEEIAAKVGMTRQNLYNIIKKNDTSSENLTKIAEVLGVDPNVFFKYRSYEDYVRNEMVEDNSLETYETNTNDIIKENNFLKTQLEEKSDYIRLLKNEIDRLSNELKNSQNK